MAIKLIEILVRSIYAVKHAINNIIPTLKRAGILPNRKKKKCGVENLRVAGIVQKSRQV